MYSDIHKVLYQGAPLKTVRGYGAGCRSSGAPCLKLLVNGYKIIALWPIYSSGGYGLRPNRPDVLRGICVDCYCYGNPPPHTVCCIASLYRTCEDAIPRLCHFTRARLERKKNHLEQGGFLGGGGERGIRTPDTLLTYTHFPGVRIRPLCHLSGLVGLKRARIIADFLPL